MNRNVESHFSMLPSADIDRSRFDRSQDVKFTGNVGELIPFYVDEVLPGDSFDITTSKVIRLQTLLTPVMDNIYLDTYWFFIPNRLVWSHWRELMGENTQSAWLPEVEYQVPQIYLADSYGLGAVEGDGAVKTGDILDYMGVPVGVSTAGAETRSAYAPSINALPLRAYQLVFNDWFRDENLVDPVNIQKGDTSYDYYSDNVPKKPYIAAKYHDYFTSALPAPQKGPSVSVPTSFNASSAGMSIGWPVKTENASITNATASGIPLRGDFVTSGGSSSDYRVSSGTLDASGGPMYYLAADSSSGFYPKNLFAAPASNDSSGLFVDVNDLRYAFQLQKLYERDARGGRGFLCLHVKKIEEKIWKAA